MPPDAWRGWALLAMVYAMVVISGGSIFYAYGVFVDGFVHEFDTSYAMVSLPLTAALVVSSLASAPIGWISNRYELRWLVLFGALASALGLALVSLAGNMMQILLLYVLLIGTADVLIGTMLANMLIATWFERRRGLAIGIAAAGSSTAAICFPPLAVLIDDAAGWRNTFRIFALLLLMIGPAIAYLARPPRGGIPVHERKRPAEPAKTHIQPPREPEALLTVKQFVLDREFWVIVFTIGIITAFNAAVMATLVPFAVETGIDRLTAAKLVSLTGLMALIGKLSFGTLADFINLRWVLRAALCAGAASMAIMATMNGLWALATAAALYGLSLGAMLPLWGAMTAQSYPLSSYGRALGATKAAMTPMNFAPLLLGWLYDQTGEYRLGWTIICAMSLGGLAISFLRRPAGQTPFSHQPA